jgi:hypothetical protein
MINENLEKQIAKYAQIKTPIGVLVVALFILDSAIGVIAVFAKISDNCRGWLLFFALVILLYIVYLTFKLLKTRRWQMEQISAVIKVQDSVVIAENVDAPRQKSNERTSAKTENTFTSSQFSQENGVKWTVSPDGRTEAYESLRQRARHKISILGIAMTDLTEQVFQSLGKNAENVNIDLLMIDPEYLKSKPDVAEELSKAFNIGFITGKAEDSFGRLKNFCQDWNADHKHIHKFQFKVYQHLPAFGMVMIDDHDSGGEMICENYLYKMSIRPRFELVCHANNNRLFQVYRLEYNEAWKRARWVVAPS